MNLEGETVDGSEQLTTARYKHQPLPHSNKDKL